MSVYYIFGKDELIIREKAEDRLGAPRRADIARHYAEDMKWDALYELITARDLFSLEEYHWVSGVSALGITAKNEEAFIDALKAGPPNKRIAFTQNTNFKDWRKGKEYERSHVHKALDEAANEVYDLTSATYPNRVAEWTGQRMLKHGLLLTDAGVEYLAGACA